MKLNQIAPLALASMLTMTGCKEEQANTTRQQVTSAATTASVHAKPTAKPKELPKPKPPEDPCQPKEVNLKGVTVIPREAWGAKPANLAVLKTMSNCANFPIKKVTVHNTGEGSETVAGQERMRLLSAQMAHMDPRFKKNWGDIAYHYLVGISGEIYEGRNPTLRGDSGGKYYPGDKGHSHTPEHHLLIAVIGNYDMQKMTTATRTSLTKLIAANLHQYDLSPNDVIIHKDIAYTSCPGDDLAEWVKGSGKYAIKATHQRLLTK